MGIMPRRLSQRQWSLAITLCVAPLLSQGCAMMRHAPDLTAPPATATIPDSTGKSTTPRDSNVSALSRPKIDGAPDAQSRRSEMGAASWYGRRLHGKLTASGTTFDQTQLTAAHQTLPFGSRVKVTNLTNGKSVEVEITDRGPFVADRIIDLSAAAAKALEMVESGVTPVRIEVLTDDADLPAEKTSLSEKKR